MTLLFTLLLLTDPAGEVLQRPVHTYSIVAYDPVTQEVGGAVQSHWFSVADVIWVRPGVGAVATQSFVRYDYGPLGLDAMASGQVPAEVLKHLTAADEGRDVRQVAMVDVKGNAAGYTGAKCIDYACDQQGETFSVQANIMLKDGVCAAMEKAFTQTKGPLADRLLAALRAAQAEGGDLRGSQSSAIKVVSAKKPDQYWQGTVVDLRVADHPKPVEELARLLDIHKAYTFMGQGDQALEKGEIDRAMKLYKTAVGRLPGRVEPLFWQAVNLVSSGKTQMALPLFKTVFEKSPDWRLMPERLAKVGLLPEDAATLESIAAQ